MRSSYERHDTLVKSKTLKIATYLFLIISKPSFPIHLHCSQQATKIIDSRQPIKKWKVFWLLAICGYALFQHGSSQLHLGQFSAHHRNFIFSVYQILNLEKFRDCPIYLNFSVQKGVVHNKQLCLNRLYLSVINFFLFK